MKNIKKVMVCVDFSDYSKKTIEYALAITLGLDVEILLFNVVNNKDIDAVRMALPFILESRTIENYIEQIRYERLSAFDALLQQDFASERSRMTPIVQVGIPYEEILNTIEKEKVDLVVLANKGRSDLIGTLHGSNGERVFRHSPVPVVSVRDRTKFHRNRT